MTPVKHLRTRFPLHKNFNKWYWIQPWPLVLLSISTTSVPVYPPVRPITHDRVEDPSVQLAAPSSHQPMSTGKKYKTVMLGIIRGIHTIYKLYWTGIVTENKIMRWLSNTDLDVAAIKLGNVADVPVDMMCYFLLFKKKQCKAQHQSRGQEFFCLQIMPSATNRTAVSSVWGKKVIFFCQDWLSAM